MITRIDDKHEELKKPRKTTHPEYNISINHANLLFFDGPPEKRDIEALNSYGHWFDTNVRN